MDTMILVCMWNLSAAAWGSAQEGEAKNSSTDSFDYAKQKPYFLFVVRARFLQKVLGLGCMLRTATLKPNAFLNNIC